MSDRQIHVQQFQGISANDDARLHAGNACESLSPAHGEQMVPR